MSNDDGFNFNYGQALTATAHYKEGEEILLSIKKERYKHEYPYITHLCKCCRCPVVVVCVRVCVYMHGCTACMHE